MSRSMSRGRQLEAALEALEKEEESLAKKEERVFEWEPGETGGIFGDVPRGLYEDLD